VQKGRIFRIYCIYKIILPFCLLVVFSLIPAVPSHGALISGSYELSWDQDVDKTETETTDIQKFKQTLEFKYKGFLSPVVENEMTFKIEQEINSDAPDTTRFLPTVDLGLKGNFWEARAGGKRTQENSDDPGQNKKITDNFFVEFFYLPPKNVPDLKAKYTLDTDEEDGVTDTEDQEITLSSTYKPTDWLDLKGDYTRSESEDEINPDSDTEGEDINGSVAFRHFLSDKIKVDAQYDVEISKNATLLDGGGKTNQTDDRIQRVKSSLSFRPFVTTDLVASYDYELDQDKETGEATITRDTEISVTQQITEVLDLRGEYRQNSTEENGTADDNEETEDQWIAELKAIFSKQLDFSIKYEKTDTDVVHDDPALNTTSGTRIWNGTWTGELAPFWKASASYDRTENLENDETATIENKYILKSTFDFKAINLTLDPTYDVTMTEDRQISPAEETEIKDFRFRIAWMVFTTRTMDAKFDHTYGRKTDSGADNIERTDDTSVNFTWTDPFPGWTFGFDLTRRATDTSEDDLPPDITSTFGFRADYQYEQVSMSLDTKYDKKSLTDDNMTFDAKVGWTAPRWDTELTYSFDKTFSDERNEGYSISLSFKYNL
jgi:predicted porin